MSEFTHSHTHSYTYGTTGEQFGVQCLQLGIELPISERPAEPQPPHAEMLVLLVLTT